MNYVLFPSIYSDWLYTGDLLRTASYVVLLVGAAREITGTSRPRRRVAVLDDRRRLARELHDGLVQELVYIRSAAHDLRECTASPPTRSSAPATRPSTRRGRRSRRSAELGRAARLRAAPGGPPGRRAVRRTAHPRGPRRLRPRRRAPAARPGPHHPRGRVERPAARSGADSICVRLYVRALRHLLGRGRRPRLRALRAGAEPPATA